MRRFLLPVLLMLTLLVTACGADQGPKWGNLELTLEKVEQTDRQWTARMVLRNPTDKVQVIEYNAPARYTMIITKDGQEVLTRPFDVRTKQESEILNLAKGVAKEYVVAWTYLDAEGNRVPPGTYEISVRLEAVTVVQGAGQPTIFEPKTVGPVKVTVQ